MANLLQTVTNLKEKDTSIYTIDKLDVLMSKLDLETKEITEFIVGYYKLYLLIFNKEQLLNDIKNDKVDFNKLKNLMISNMSHPYYKEVESIADSLYMVKRMESKFPKQSIKEIVDYYVNPDEVFTEDDFLLLISTITSGLDLFYNDVNLDYFKKPDRLENLNTPLFTGEDSTILRDIYEVFLINGLDGIEQIPSNYFAVLGENKDSLYQLVKVVLETIIFNMALYEVKDWKLDNNILTNTDNLLHSSDDHPSVITAMEFLKTGSLPESNTKKIVDFALGRSNDEILIDIDIQTNINSVDIFKRNINLMKGVIDVEKGIDSFFGAVGSLSMDHLREFPLSVFKLKDILKLIAKLLDDEEEISTATTKLVIDLVVAILGEANLLRTKKETNFYLHAEKLIKTSVSPYKYVWNAVNTKHKNTIPISKETKEALEKIFMFVPQAFPYFFALVDKSNNEVTFFENLLDEHFKEYKEGIIYQSQYNLVNCSNYALNELAKNIEDIDDYLNIKMDTVEESQINESKTLMLLNRLLS